MALTPQECKQLKFAGKSVIMEYAYGCGDAIPEAGDWKRLGAMTTKELTISYDTIDVTADDSVGGIRENMASFMTATISGDGRVKNTPDMIELLQFYVAPPGGQPNLWLRLTYPDVTFKMFAILNNFSRSAPFDDSVTYSLEAMATASDFGLIVEATPQPVPPTGVTITGANTVAEGATITLTAAVAPAGASQSVTWDVDDADVATVVGGVVTGVSAGPAVITAKSVVDPSKTATHTVTVTA